MDAEQPQPTVRELFEQYKPVVTAAIMEDTAYRNACGHSDHENAVIEGNAAIRRAILRSGDLQLIRLYSDMPEFRRRLHQEVIDETYPQLHELLHPLSQDDIDDALRAWNGNMDSKRAVVRYMEAHARDRDTAAWLSREYGGDENRNLFIVRAGSPETVELPWTKVQRRIAQLISEGRFFTEEELDNFEDIDSAAIRERLEHDEPSPFVEQVMADVEQIAAQESAVEEPQQEDTFIESAPAAEELTTLQKKADEIAKKYESLPLQEKIGIIAQAFGCTSGKIETSPCYGDWRGTSDIFIRFDNGGTLSIGNCKTPRAKTVKAQNEFVNTTLKRYNPEIVAIAKETALAALRKREAKDNAIAAEKGLKPYTLLNVELNSGADSRNGGYIGWYYVTLAVDGKVRVHLESGLSYEIASGEVSETPSRRKYFVAGALKESDVDYVFDNVGFSSTSGLYSLPISKDVLERAEKTLADRMESAHPAMQEPPVTKTAPDSNKTRDPLAPAYKVGDTVYLDDDPFEITEVRDYEVQLRDPTLLYPIFRSESKESFEELLHRDERNSAITDFLAADLDLTDDDFQAVLTDENGFFSQSEKDEISSWIRAGEPNSKIAERLASRFSNRSDSMEYLDVRADHFSTSDGLEIVFMDNSDNRRGKLSGSWAEIAEIVRAMYQQERDGFYHEPTHSVSEIEVPADEPPVPAPAEPTVREETVAVYPAEPNHLPFDVVFQTLHIDEIKQEQQLPAENFRITDDNLGVGGAKAKFRMNMDAINLLKELESDGRQATPEEQEVLSRYVGWGSLPDAFDETKTVFAEMML